MQQLTEDVEEGTLDYVLTKPADAQLLVSIRRFGLWQVVDVLVRWCSSGSPCSAWTPGRRRGGACIRATLVLGAIDVYCF